MSTQSYTTAVSARKPSSRPRAAGSTGPIGQPTPYSVQASCVLSEDYFLTDQVTITPATDLIRPFVQSDGTVEALIVKDGNLAHLRHDPAVPCGWSYTPLSNNQDEFPLVIPDGIIDVAVGRDSSGVVTGIFVIPSGDTQYPYLVGPLFFDTPSGTWSTIQEDYWTPSTQMSAFRAELDPTGNLYFYTRDDSGTFWLYQPTQLDFQPQQLSTPGAGDVTDAWVLWNSGYDQESSTAGGILLTDSQGIISWYAQVGETSFDALPNFTEGPGTLLWVGPPQNPNDNEPTFAYQAAPGGDNPPGDIVFTNTQGFNVATGAFGAELGPEKVAVWQAGGLFTFAALFGDTVNVIAEYGDPREGTVTDPIPLQPGVMAVFSAPADPEQGTLFVLLDDTTLNVLAKDPAAGWSLIPAVQDKATLQELDGWRVQLSVTDANGAPVAGAPVSVTADRPIGTWQASGNTLLGPADPAAFTTDAHGRVTFATPAVELDAAQLTVQIMPDDDSADAGPPVIVSPDADVHAFLAGAAPLNELGTLTPKALLTATKADNSPLCPVLASVPPGNQQTQAASDVISAMTQCIRAGQGVTPGSEDAKSWLLDMSGKVPKYSSSTEPGGVQAVYPGGVESAQSLSDWWDSVKNDADSFFHGLRHDATHIVTCAANWVKDEAGDAYHWVVNLAVTFGDDIAGFASYLITDMKSAIHAVTGFFHKMGADIGDVTNWLRHNVGDLIQQAGQNAKQVETWLGQLPGLVNNRLTEYGTLAKGFFTGLETTIDNDIDALMPGLVNSQLTFGSPVPSPPSAAFDVAKFLGSVQHNWLLDKIESFFAGDTPAAQNADLQAALDQLAIALQSGLQFVTEISDLLWTGLKDLFATKGSYDSTELAQLLTLLKSTLHDLLAFADAIAQALIDLAKAAMDQLGSMLSHGFIEIPLVGKLLAHFGVDPTMDVAHIVSLVLMYPATLANRIKNGPGSPLFPVASIGTGGEPGIGAQLDWAAGLQLSAAVGQGIWGFADAVGDAQRAGGEEPSGVIGWIDIASPVVLAILGWPGALNADGTTAPPFANLPDSSGHDGAMIWPNWLLGLVPPIAGLCGQFADYKPSGVSALDEEEPEWPEIGQYFTMASAVGATILGSIYNFQTGQSSDTKAAGILGNVSNIIAPFATKELAESSEGVSEVIKLCVDIAGNIGAAVAMGEGA